MPCSDPDPLPLAPRDMVASGLCVGCGACAARPGAAMRPDAYGQLKPSSRSPATAQRTTAFAALCPFSPAARNEDDLAQARFGDTGRRDPWIGRFQAAYVGHVAEGEFRALGSSGGMANWTAAELLRTGAVDAVAHVSPQPAPEAGQPFFAYRLSRSQDELRGGAQSRYYPVELSGVIEAIRATPGRYAVVGVPCFIKAVHLLRAQDAVLRDRIAVTLGLFCGHMKSARMVESFAWQMGARAAEVGQIDYRVKDPTRPANWYTARIGLKSGGERRHDWWGLVDGDWGAGFFQNSACDACDDVTAETADIAFGDAWLEPYSSDGRGTNVVVVRTPELDRLVQAAITEGRLSLSPVDADFVRRTQAAGFRQRREGLSYRLTWARRGLRPVKRVAPAAQGLAWRRKAIYRLRHQISVWSHRMFFLARLTRRPSLYLRWARLALTVYHGFAYSRGRLGALIDRLEALGQRAAGKIAPAE